MWRVGFVIVVLGWGFFVFFFIISIFVFGVVVWFVLVCVGFVGLVLIFLFYFILRISVITFQHPTVKILACAYCV